MRHNARHRQAVLPGTMQTARESASAPYLEELNACQIQKKTNPADFGRTSRSSCRRCCLR
ncbi:hypothetical protein HOE425_330164 [Hoeflea sp. EC-HK425]|nr:hypothetical protein HOE425_330164 [Hoeflea sp. EC-HK425]